MKRILFNDKFGLTRAVLEGRKTMTRRIITDVKAIQSLLEIEEDGALNDADPDVQCIIDYKAKYKVGEVVAVAQSYLSLNKSGYVAPEWLDHYCEDSAGYENKMFVRADLMPHLIRITNVRIERLQDISEDDCIKEGIIPDFRVQSMSIKYYVPNFPTFDFTQPRDAFAFLIDKVSGKGTWESNSLVFVYSFELAK